MRAIVLIIVAMLMGSCTTTRPPVVITKVVPIKTPESLMVCPEVRLPPADSLTDKQVARAVVELKTSNSTCLKSMRAIKAYQDKVELDIAGSAKDH